MRSPTDPPRTLLGLDVVKVAGRKVWPYFAPHHYLSERYNGSHAFLVLLPDGEPIAFTAVIVFPHGKMRNAWRGHRTVVLPDYQGLGLGARLNEWRAEWVLTTLGGRFFFRTSHPRLGLACEGSPLWRPTSSNRKYARADAIASQRAHLGWVADAHRLAWSFEYKGRKDTA